MDVDMDARSPKFAKFSNDCGTYNQQVRECINTASNYELESVGRSTEYSNKPPLLDEFRNVDSNPADELKSAECSKVCTIPLKLPNLQDVIINHAAEWRVLGALFHISIGQLDIIEATNPNDPEGCCSRVLKIWLTTDNSASWEKLLAIIESPAVSNKSGIQMLKKRLGINTDAIYSKSELFTLSSIPKDEIHSTPQLGQLFTHITPRYFADWRVIGELLGLPEKELKSIKDIYPMNPRWCCNRMLESWLKTDPSATWIKMFEAIESPAMSGASINDNAVYSSSPEPKLPPRGKDFDCLAMAQYFKTNKVKLCRLKYQSMRKQLMAHNVITKDEADEIDGINVHSDKMDKVITIVETSLALELTTKYRGFLKSMKESEDDTLKEYAKKLPIVFENKVSGKLHNDQFFSNCNYKTHCTKNCSTMEQSQCVEDKTMNLESQCEITDFESHFLKKGSIIFDPGTTLSVEIIERIAVLLSSSSRKEWEEVALPPDCGISGHFDMIYCKLRKRTDVTIKVLTLKNNKMTDEDAVSVSRTVVNCNVEKLYINGNHGIGESEQLYSMLTSPYTNLKILHMRDVKLSNSGVGFLFSRLQHNNALKELVIDSNDITNPCAAITTALKHNNCLTKLWIHDNKISGNTSILILDALKCNDSLKRLILPNPNENTVSTIRSLQKTVNKEREDRGCYVRLEVDLL